MKKILFNRYLYITLALAVVLSTIFNTNISFAKTEESSITKEEITTIQESLKFNRISETYIFDKEYAINNGLTENQALNLKSFFENINKDQIKEFNTEIGFKPDLKGETEENDVITPRVPPLLIPVLAFIGGAAAGKLLDEVMNYGIAKACEWNKGKWAIFDDYCENR